MLPLISNGSLVNYRPARHEDVSPGDIIIFRREGILITHRLIGKKPDGDRIQLREKGDNQLRGTWIKPDQLVGKATCLTSAHDRRRLELNADSARLRLLTALMRAEADAIEAYLLFKGSSRLLAWIRWPAMLAGLVVAPFRAALLRILLTAYPRERRADTDDVQRLVLRAYRFATAVCPATEAGTAVEDWQSLLDALAWHRLATPAVGVLSRDAAQVPAQVVTQLKQIAYRGAITHNAALAALGDVDRALRSAQIRYAVLKGPYLYEALYRDRFPRDYEDLDILVAPEHVDQAVSLLHSVGYNVVGRAWTQAALRRGHFHLALHAGVAGRPPIELHWSLVDRANLYRIPDADVVARVRDFRAGDRTFSVLSAEDELIYLCLHAAKHGVLNGTALKHGLPPEWFCRASSGNCLIWFLDLELFLRNEMDHLDWQAIAVRSREWNVADEVIQCMEVLRALQPESVAAAAINRLGGTIEMPAQKTGGVLFRTKAGERLIERSMQMNKFLFIRPVRLLMIGRLLFPPPRLLLRYYGTERAWLAPLLYLVHPFHMLRKVLSRV